MNVDVVALSEISACFEGVVPAVISTAAADGTPNVTHLSRVHLVDDDHVALSNQFFSKTVRNLAENPTASVMLVDPIEFDEYRLTLRWERSERRGPLFDRMALDIDAIAALTGMQGVFQLRSADVYRLLEVERVATARNPDAS